MKQANMTALIAGIAVLVYFLSPPLVIFCLAKVGAPSSAVAGQALEIFYLPAKYVYDNCPPYRTFLDAQFKMLGVR
jgi:hypothetical protein